MPDEQSTTSQPTSQPTSHRPPAAQLAALRANADQKTAQYLDLALADAVARMEDRVTAVRRTLQGLDVRLADLAVQLEELKAAAAAEGGAGDNGTYADGSPAPDDRYALTKAKLIQLMKELGIYD
jgi:hypothetical protein